MTINCPPLESDVWESYDAMGVLVGTVNELERHLGGEIARAIPLKPPLRVYTPSTDTRGASVIMFSIHRIAMLGVYQDHVWILHRGGEALMASSGMTRVQCPLADPELLEWVNSNIQHLCQRFLRERRAELEVKRDIRI